MPTDEDRSERSGRAEIIAVVKTPLGFFALAVLLVEGSLGGLALTSSRDHTLIIISMVSIIGLLIAIVCILAYWRPEALYGKRSDLASITALQDQVRQLQTENQQWKSQCQQLEETNVQLGHQVRQLQTENRQCESKRQQLEKTNAQLKTELRQLTDLKSRILSCVAGSRSASLETILAYLYPMANFPPNTREHVQSLIGSLIDEHRIEPDVDGTSGYYRIPKLNI